MASFRRKPCFFDLGISAVNFDTSNIYSLALNERGAKTAIGLGLKVEVGLPSQFLDQYWNQTNSLVLVMALPIVVRLLVNRNLKKDTDPVVIAIDESGEFVIPVLGGHRGANRLASELSSRKGSTAVITTASEKKGISAADGLTGFSAQGEVAALIELMLEGLDPVIENEINWPGPINLKNGPGPARIIISDKKMKPSGNKASPEVQLIPASLVLGIGCSSDASAGEVGSLIEKVLERNSLDIRAVAKIATIDMRKDHPAIVGQGIEIESFTAEQLDQVDVPNGSEAVRNHVGTRSVSEAAAILGSRSGQLLVTKEKSDKATVSVARIKPTGSIKLVGLGPGSSMMRTPQAVEALLGSEVVIGYQPYIEQCQELLSPHQLIIRSPIGDELKRVKLAIEYASAGRATAIVCSGDPEVFAMASITFEVLHSISISNGLKPADLPEVSVVPGITAGLASGALLGAPLGHDHAYLSLSDLLTPWETIENRIEKFAEADITIVIYNPQSKTRTWQLPKALDIIAKYRKPQTAVAVVKNVGRQNQQKLISTLDSVDPGIVDMNSVVIIGSSTTTRFGDYIFTPRGYRI